MKNNKIYLIVFLLIILGSSYNYGQGNPFSTKGWWGPAAPKFSPVVSGDNSITFRLKEPEATSVELHFGEWDVQKKVMLKDKDGNWTVTLDSVPPGIYQYNFFVNGHFRKLDPENPNIKVGTKVYGSIVEVPGDPARFDELQDVPHGDVHIINYRSKTLGRIRKMFVYVPKIYLASPEKKFPVLYLRHGGGDNEGSWVNDGHANIILDNLINEGKAKPMLIVMSNGLIDGSWASGSTVEGMEYLEEELFKDIIPVIEKRYHVSKNKDDRAIAGLSMGGGQAVVIGMRNPDKFSYVGDFSAGILSDPEINMGTYIPGVFNKSELLNKSLELLWIACGSKDPRFEGHKQFVTQLENNGIDAEFYVASYGHEWQFWREQLRSFTERLFKN
ncbi:esterase [Christiangramia sp.]|uniref:esterase n=1 Tax=Christiangramia sp. TaxID=1931228 RepID=UPI00262211AE|nr:esterase [Christiangramia sp.]